jgi:hypothetical protein
VEVQHRERRRVGGERVAQEVELDGAADEPLLAGRGEPGGQRVPMVTC